MASKKTKVVVLGHSYVQHLDNMGGWERKLELLSKKEVDCKFLFKACPGKDFRYWIETPGHFDIVQVINPDIVVVILGGNSITEEYTNSEIKVFATEFYTKLKSVLRDDCLRLDVQVEPRFVTRPDRFGTPGPEEFNRRRTIVNNFMNKELKKAGLIHRVILLGSVNYLREEKYFTDEVHLTRPGLEKYREAVIRGIMYAREERDNN